MMSIASFCDLYGINEDALHQCKFNKTLPASIFKKVKRLVYVDEKYIIRRYEFKRRIANICQDFYYYFNRYFSTSTIAYMLSKINGRSQAAWHDFMSNQLFQIADYTVLNFRVKPKMWEFFRNCRWILIHIFKLKGLHFRECDINKVHELENK